MAEGYIYGQPCSPDCWDDEGFSNSVEGMYSSARDLAKMLSFLLRDPAQANNGQQILSSSSIRHMMKLQWMTKDKAAGFSTPFQSYFLDKYLIRTTEGDGDGYSSWLMAVPDLKLGLVVLTNQAFAAVQFGRRAAEILVPALEAALTGMTTTATNITNVNDYLGDYQGVFYQDDFYGQNPILVSITGDSRFMFASSNYFFFNGYQYATLKPVTTDSFQLIPTPGYQPSCFAVSTSFFEYAYVNFKRTAGVVTSLEILGVTGGVGHNQLTKL